ncbi:hypothetical protein QO259_16175 [Salinicola sp. JS01]|uniref:hypothetical protein n=1 Tax=Salinicola sp. JS01 TaxID=3050071 RepID=UPI00255B773A|nr:hypothetical protein [Salinicola sp. JS01]WIX32325.1 hypothetical protein QO259_16175 [Salinicola sp. JS01]
MPRRQTFGWAWRVPCVITVSLIAAGATGNQLTRGLVGYEPLERLYAGLFGSLAVGLLLLVAGLLAPDADAMAGRLGAGLLLLGLTLGLLT